MEYPFKDLLPLDEVLEREGYYKDWTHLDPEVFYSLTQISEYIKTKGYGVDVRLLIAQLAEHFGLKTTQVVDLANLLQQKFTNLEGVTQSFTNNINSLVAQMEADKDAVIANATVDSEVILARGGKPTLQARLDETDTQLAQIHYNVLNEEVLPTDINDTERIQRTIDKANENETVLIPYRSTPYQINNVKMKRGVKVICNSIVEVVGDGSIGFNFESVLYATLENANIFLTEPNQVALKMCKTETGQYTQLNTFRNVKIEGFNIENTTSLDIADSYVNNFYNCWFFRTAYGIKFGKVTNANNFYGCEVRGERTHVNSRLAISLENAGDGNIFHGGVIENYRDGIKVNGGHFACLGTYVEGFGSNQRIWLENGSLTFKDCLFSALATIRGGDKFVFEDNRVSWGEGVLNINYPVIRYENDVPTLLKTSGNTWIEGGYLTRFGMYNDGSGFKKRTKINEVSDEYHTVVTGRLTNDEEDVTGDGTEHVITWGNFNEDNDLRNEMNAPTGEFTPKFDGFYRLKTTVTLTGVNSTHQRAVLMVRTLTGTSSATLARLKETSTNVRNQNGLMTIEGDVILFLTAGSRTTFTVKVDGGDKTVTVNRVSATLGHTYYNITRV